VPTPNLHFSNGSLFNRVGGLLLGSCLELIGVGVEHGRDLKKFYLGSGLFALVGEPACEFRPDANGPDRVLSHRANSLACG
jgi:hypothetical protein